MTLAEAIENSKEAFDFYEMYSLPAYGDAIQLGIEALKHVKTQRQFSSLLDCQKLPGETEE